ncbi:MAG: glycosyltransferase [Flavobacteriaceae bacterium]|nr:glycosyltransferase [Flavobacteriaceae bacterium]
MLSVLIPTYNYNVVELVKALYKQLEKQNILFEIICFDNASNSSINTKNEVINKMEFCYFTSLKQDVGRSKIRNLLAQKSKFDWLLFLDADVLPVIDLFIENYLTSIKNEEKVVYGGLKYKDEKPNSNKLLRWVYGKGREEISLKERNLNPNNHFSSANFLIHKNVFKIYNFDESLTEYGHEDTLLGLELVRNNISITQIDNPVYHLGLDESSIFLQKTKTAVENLFKLQKQGKISELDNKLLKRYLEFKKMKVIKLFAFLFQKNEKIMKRNLISSNPSLFIFDLYKLGYLCMITSN